MKQLIAITRYEWGNNEGMLERDEGEYVRYEDIQRLERAYEAAVAFINTHKADHDLTDDSCVTCSRYVKSRKELEDAQ